MYFLTTKKKEKRGQKKNKNKIPKNKTTVAYSETIENVNELSLNTCRQASTSNKGSQSAPRTWYFSHINRNHKPNQ